MTKSSKSKTVLVGRLRDATKLVPRAELTRFMSDALDAYREIKTVDREIAEIESHTARAIETIRQQHESLRTAMNHIFNERRQVIEKHFQVIDAALASGDRDLLIQGLRSLGEVVATSPFADIATFARALESGEDIEI